MQKEMDGILEKAKNIFLERGKEYGNSFDICNDASKLWSVILGVEVEPRQVALCMIGLKLARLKQNGSHEDTAIDIAGYVAVYWEIISTD